MRPRPCGHHGSALRTCHCPSDTIERYQRRISAPLLDRIDLRVEVPAVAAETLAAAPDGDPSAVVGQRVALAQQRQLAPQVCLNATLDSDGIDRHCTLDAASSKFLQAAAARLGWAARSFQRVLRIDRTVADMAGAAGVQVAHIAKAVQYRGADRGQLTVRLAGVPTKVHVPVTTVGYSQLPMPKGFLHEHMPNPLAATAR